MLEAADDSTMDLQNDANYMPNNKAPRLRGPEYLDSNYSKRN